MVFNTGETTESLRNEYNPEGSVLRRCQLRMLDMLCYLDEVCEKLGIEYCLDSGNVLGAVRHGGFIPWDDDVDVIIKKEDEKKLKHYLLENPHPQYVLQCHTTDPNFFNTSWLVLRDLKSEYYQDSAMHNTRKYRGMQIDICSVQIGTISALFWIDKKITAFNNNYLAGRCRFIPNVIFRIQQHVLNPFFSFLSKLFGDNRYSYAYGIYWGKKYDQETLFPPKRILFEGKYFFAPGNLKKYLTTMFGDNYMSLPPKNERNWHKASYSIDD